jgi:pentatricopeptide repeat protein
LRKLRAQPLDYSEPDPVKAIHRLDVVSEPTSKFADYKELFKLPAYDVFQHSPETLKKLDGKADELNAAIHNIYNGTQRRNWQQAWTKGFVVLHEKGQERLAKLDMQTLENLLKMSLRLPLAKFQDQWPTIRDSLLYHLALKECDLASRESTASILANWVSAELNTNTGDSIDRVVGFWKTFSGRLKADKTRPRNPDAIVGGPMPFAIPCSLFSSVLLAHCLSGKTSLQDFIDTLAGNIAVPEAYDSPFDYARLLQSLAYLAEHKEAAPWRRDSDGASPTSDVNESISANTLRIKFWFDQIELARMWLRSAESGLCLLCAKWRDRDNQRALHESWEMIKTALRPPKALESDKWMEVDWIPDSASKATSKTAADSDTLPEGVENQASAIAERLNESMGLASPATLDEGDAKPQRGRRRAQVPGVFTPEVVSEYLRSFMQLKMESSAEDLWSFVEDDLSLVPGLSMWTAILLAQSRQGDTDTEKVQDTIRKMQNAGIAPDAVCWSIAVTACFQAGRMEEGLDTMQQLFSDKTLRTRFPDGKLPVHIYNVIINSLFYNDMPDPALEMLAKMRKDGVAADIYTVNIILRYYSRAKSHNLQAISKHLQLVEEHQLMPDIVTFTTILDALMRAGRQDAIERVRHIMTSMGVKPNAVTYGALVDYLVKSSVESGQENGIRAALELLYQMQNSEFKDGVKPTENLYTAIVQGLARFSVRHDSPQHLDMAEQIHYEMTCARIQPNRITYNSLMTANLSHHRTDRAIEHLDSYRAMKSRKQISTSGTTGIADGRKILSDHVPIRMWQALLAGLLAKGQHARAQAVIEEMREIGIDFNSGALQKMRDTAYEASGE